MDAQFPMYIVIRRETNYDNPPTIHKELTEEILRGLDDGAVDYVINTETLTALWFSKGKWHSLSEDNYCYIG